MPARIGFGLFNQMTDAGGHLRVNVDQHRNVVLIILGRGRRMHPFHQIDRGFDAHATHHADRAKSG